MKLISAQLDYAFVDSLQLDQQNQQRGLIVILDDEGQFSFRFNNFLWNSVADVVSSLRDVI